MKPHSRPLLTPWLARLRAAVIPLAAIILVISSSVPALSLSWDLTPETTLDLDTTLSYNASWRVEDQDSKALTYINNDDGNRNFDQWDMINNRFKVTMEGDLQHLNYGVFVRGRAFYDQAYMGSNANDSPETLNNSSFFGGSLSDHQDFSDETKDRHGKDAELLDAYVYGSFNPGETNLDLRIGRQVISWGESIFVTNSISSAMSPVDATETVVPGVELRDVFLPVGQVYAALTFLKNFTMAGFYQWEWEKTRLNESGSYFATNGTNFACDAILDAGENVLLAPGLPESIDHGRDNEARDDGQFGFTLRYVAEALNYSEFGFYFINYHEKLPAVTFIPGGGTVDGSFVPALAGLDASAYTLNYAEDVKLYGFSVGTTLGDTNYGFEMSYREGYPVAVEDASSPFGVNVDADVFQAQLSFITLFPQTLLANNWQIMGEVGYNTVSGYDGELIKDEDAWGCTLKVTPSWDAIAPNLNLEVPVTASVNPNGNSAVLGTFWENANSYSIAFNFTYRAVYKVGLSYTLYTGDAEDNVNTDRDFIGISLKYTF